MIIHQSTLKAYRKYKSGDLCGHVFSAKYIDRTLIDEPSDDMRLGHYFEWITLGNLPAYGDGTPPKVEYNSRTKELKAPYQHAQNQWIEFNDHVDALGIEFEAKGKYHQNGLLGGTTDIEVAGWEYGPATIDMKYSGLLYNKWSEFGWDLEQLPYRSEMTTQARHYHLLTGKPFFFWVFSSKKLDSKLIRVEFDPGALQHHLEECERASRAIDIEIKLGFTPHQSVKNCGECPLKLGCPDRIEKPKIVTVYF